MALATGPGAGGGFSEPDEEPAPDADDPSTAPSATGAPSAGDDAGASVTSDPVQGRQFPTDNDPDDRTQDPQSFGPDVDESNPEQGREFPTTSGGNQRTQQEPSFEAGSSDDGGQEQPEMPGSTDYGDESFQDTVTTDDGGSPGGTGAGAAGRGGNPQHDTNSDGTGGAGPLVPGWVPGGGPVTVPTVQVPDVPTPDVSSITNPFEGGPLGWVADNFWWFVTGIIGLVALYLLRPVFEAAAGVTEE